MGMFDYQERYRYNMCSCQACQQEERGVQEKVQGVCERERECV